MKTIKYLIYTLIATFVFAGCSEDPTYTRGANEDPNCYGVYFPAQSKTGTIEFSPTAPTEVEFTAMRAKDNDAITVPVVVTANEEGIFNVSPIEFAEGQTETKFKVTFPKAEIGKTYSCNIVITDNLYASIYDPKSSGVDLSIVRVKWNQVTGSKGETLATWTEAFIGLIFEGGAVQKGQCKVFERDDRKGYYRFENPYNKGLVDAMFGNGAYEALAWEADIIIDATNPAKVSFADQEIGLSVNKGTPTEFGSIRMRSTASAFGTLANGVITFPASSLEASMALYNNGAYGFKNSQPLTLLLPGAKVYDFSVALTKSEPVNGKIKLGVKLGTDVAKAKYAFFEGNATAANAKEYSSKIQSGTTPSKEITATGVVEASFEKTGMYTIVANSYDASGTLQGYKYISFGYVAAGDQVAVKLGIGINITDKYAPQGNTSENSVEVYAYGENIATAYYGLFETSKIGGANLTDLVKASGTAFTAAQLEKINSTGFSAVAEGLTGGTNYTFVIWAYNGYVSKTFSASASTTGVAHPLKRKYTMEDMAETQLTKAGYTKTWNYYAVDAYAEPANTNRIKVGQVVLTDNTKDDTTDEDFLNITGLSGLTKTALGQDDTMLIEYYKGVLYSCTNQYIGMLNMSGTNYYIANRFTTIEDSKAYSAPLALIGGVVEEGYVALVANPQYITQNNLTFKGMVFLAYTDPAMTKSAGGVTSFYNMMFVDPQVDAAHPAGLPTSAPTISKANLTLISQASADPTNFVELRGRDRIRAMIDEYAGKPANKAVKTMAVEMPEMGTVDAKVSFSEGMLPVQSISGLAVMSSDAKASFNQ